MLNTGDKYLKFQSGPYGILIAITCVIEISDFRKECHQESVDSTINDRKTIRWNDMDLLRIDMRSALEVKTGGAHKPLYALILKSTTTNNPFALVTVDEVSHIMEIEESKWHALNGINPRLDAFFDRAYPDKDNGEILMRLTPVEQWATVDIGAKNAY
jgi:hypothetical protein